MNRRQFFTATGASLGLLLTTTRATLARLQHLADATPEIELKPELALEDHTASEAMYFGVLFTWLELLEDTIDALTPAIEEVESDPDSEKAKAMMLMPLGVWTHLAVDTLRISAPVTFEAAQEHTITAFSHLGTAADIISTGVVASNPTAITLGSEHINLAADQVGLLMSTLPFDRPKRDEILGE